MRKTGWMALLLALVLLAGCGAKSDETAKSGGTPAPAAESGPGDAGTAGGEDAGEESWYFQKGDVKVFMNAPAEPVIEALGAYKNSYEAPSCAFDGMDVVYTYPGYEILSYAEGGEAAISGVVLRDDTVETPEGICIGSDQAAVESAYGKLADGAASLRVTRGNCELLIILTDGAVSSIQYIALK